MDTDKPNVVFVHIPTLTVGMIEDMFDGQNTEEQQVIFPLGILYLSAYIKDKRLVGGACAIDYVEALHAIRSYDDLGDFVRRVATDSVPFAPDILAFSLNMSLSQPFFLFALRELKALWPLATAIVGGAHSTNCTRYLLETCSELDYVIRGEGEIALAELCREYPAVNADIKGVYSLKKVTEAGSDKLELSPLVENIDSIPFPDYELLNVEHYVRNHMQFGGRRKRGFSFLTTRGCPYKCSYCSSQTVHGHGVRCRSVQNVVDEIRMFAEKYQVTLLGPVDDLFTCKKATTLQILAGVQDLAINDVELQFWNGLHINSLSTEVMDALVRSNTTSVALAIESGSPEVQRNIRKNVNLGKALQVAAYLHQRGIEVRAYFILGFPGESREQMAATIDYAKRIEADWCHFSVATPLVGSEMYDQFVDKGSIGAFDADFFANSYYHRRFFDTPEISADELNETVIRATYEVNFFSNMNMRKGDYPKAMALFSYVLERYPYNVVAMFQIMKCYLKMGSLDKVADTLERIKSSINEDPRARQQFDVWRDQLEPLQQ